uniref:Outer membrane protein beta-barrel domain-containing protein n=1 Tax=Acetithermum autotrophicum TaxID=1446466 RepID=H5SVR5_ACEAU|nr:hypothetical protein HGMM_OP4C334 [Candidatus Acetothermum autotrophicum]
MRRACVVSILVVLICVSLSELGWAQGENLSVGRFVGVGARWLPNALMPVGPSDVDPALGTAFTGQYWVSDLLAIEAGGWLSGFSDSWNPRSFTSLSGGLLLKLADNPQDDLYLAGRAISVQSVFRNYCCVYREGEPPEESEKIMPPYPWPSYESRTSILAFEVAAGIERSWSAHVTTNLEFGFVYAQTMTTNLPPPGEPPPEEPVPLPKPETTAATNFGFVLHISVNFYLPRK